MLSFDSQFDNAADRQTERSEYAKSPHSDVLPKNLIAVIRSFANKATQKHNLKTLKIQNKRLRLEEKHRLTANQQL